MYIYESVHVRQRTVCVMMMGCSVIACDAHCVFFWIVEKVPYHTVYHNCSGTSSTYTWPVIWPKF